MKKNKTEKGITLVALIITIIVLLILAVVAIGVVTGDGILFHAKDASTKYAEKAEEENSTFQGYVEVIKAETKISSIASTTIDGVPIPKGFRYVEGTKADGVVIKREDKDESQFVWVPVDDINDMVICQAVDRTDEEHVIDQTTLKCSGCGEATKLAGRLYATTEGENFDANLENQKYTANTGLREPDVVTADSTNASSVLEGSYTSFADQLQAEFNEMVKSVAKYKGFYVGRYETSLDDTGKAQSISNIESAYNKTSATNWWYELYRVQKEYSTNSVQGSMIWGSQYDAMMIWMRSPKTTIAGKNTERTTGTAPDDVIKKVYDLYGNSFEWTLEADDTDSRVDRGGFGSNSISPSRRYFYSPTGTFSSYGSRLSLYIK